MRRFLFVAAVGLACGSSAKAPIVVSVAPTPSASAAITRASLPVDECKEVLAAQRKTYIAALAKLAWPEDRVTAATHAFDEGRLVTCRSFRGGAWALDIVPGEDGSVFSYDAISVSLEPVVYWHHTRVAAPNFKQMAGQAGMWMFVDAELASDYDGDGVPELWMHEYEDGVEGGHTESGRVLTLKDGAIVEYSPTKGFALTGKPVDVDGDGRLDLPVSAAIDLDGETECYGKSEWSPGKFLAHALADGTFSLSDDVAKKYVSSWCASPPTTVTHAQDSLCARLWAKSLAEIATTRKRISSCVVWDCIRETQGQAQRPGADKECAARVGAFDKTPPFTLP